MKTLLVINSSGRHTRSITRRLTARFADQWKARTAARVIARDLTLQPPPVVNEAWVAAAFRDPRQRTADDLTALSLSETLIGELEAADVVVIGAPIYNFGMPAQLKAYLDQIVLVGRTFSINLAAAEPYAGLVASKPVVAITSAGDGALFPGGALAHLNFLEPHLSQVLKFIGLEPPAWVRVGYEEFGDDRLQRSLRTAESTVDELAARLAEAARASERQPDAFARPGCVSD